MEEAIGKHDENHREQQLLTASSKSFQRFRWIYLIGRLLAGGNAGIFIRLQIN